MIAVVVLMSDKAKLINEYLYQLRNKVFQKEIELMQKGFMLTPTLLKEAVNDHVDAVNQKLHHKRSLL